MAEAQTETAPGPAVIDGGSMLLRLAALLARRRHRMECAAWLISALAFATLLRSAIGAITSGVPLIFYFPAVSIVALFTGWECGVVAVMASALLAWYLFFPPALTWHVPTPQQGLILASWIIVAGTQVAIAEILRLALQRSFHGETRYRKLLDAAAGTMWTANERGEIEAPQASWAALTGMQWPDYAGREWVAAVNPEDRGRLALLDEKASGEMQQSEIRLWNAEAGDWRWYLARSVRLPRLSGERTEWITSLDDIHEHKLANERRDIVIGELRHRLKNLLTVIDALAKSSRPRVDKSGEVAGFLKRFLGRLHALGAAADLILAGKNISVECGALVRAALSPFMEERTARFFISGPVLRLSEETGGTLGLALHELATNAVKYGALSNSAGVVSVAWSVTLLEEDQERVVFEWRERNGPPPSPPSKEGFGTRLIRSVPARERDGEVDIRYDAEGFYCRISFLHSIAGLRAELRCEAAE